MPLKSKNKSKMHTVKSGIGLSAFEGKVFHPKESFITSRPARVLLAGAGFLADAYDLFVINLVLRLLKDEYPEYGASGHLHALEGFVAAAALIGSILGQLVAGSLADIVGRKKIFVVTAILITIGSIGSACCSDGGKYLTIYGEISFWRFFLGAGVGGEYPLAATVTSESSSPANRGSIMASVFAMQGVGSILSVVVVIVCLELGMSNNFTWRFALAFGAAPALLAFPWRLRMHETETFERVRRARTDHCAGQSNNSTDQNFVVVTGGDGGKDENLSERSALVGDRAAYGATASVERQQYRDDLDSDNNTLSKSRSDKTVSAVDDSGSAHDYKAVDTSDRDAKAQEASASLLDHSEQSQPLHVHNVPPSPRHNISFDQLNAHTTLIDKLDKRTEDDARLAHVSQCAAQPGRLSEIQKAFKYYKYHLLGTALCWFLLDVDFYANNLFNHDITASVLTSTANRSADGSAPLATTPLSDAYNAAILCVIAIPGYLLSIRYMEVVGRKNIQLFGFLAMALLFLLCSLLYDILLEDPAGGMGRKYAYLFLYALTFLFSNFGPNTTSFIIPGEIYPPHVRATCHGISAAAGKLGAATGAYFFPLFLGPGGSANPTKGGVKTVMVVCAIVAILGALSTYFFTPDYNAESLVDEEQYLALEHACLLPSPEDLRALDEDRVARRAQSADSFEMVQIVDRADDYDLDGSGV